MLKERVKIERNTKETQVKGQLNMGSIGDIKIQTPIGFFTHMLETFALHGGFGLELISEGDIHVDQHHLVEDTGLVLGRLFRQATSNKKGLQRAGFFMMPMDDALATAAVDFGGRPFSVVKAQFNRRFCGEFDLDLLPDFFRAFTDQAAVNVHLCVNYGQNDHHKVEALFKAWARATAMAVSVVNGSSKGIPSTKGVIE